MGRSNKRSIRPDEAIVAHRADLEMLRAVRDGLVVRPSAAVMAPYLLDGRSVRLTLVRLHADDLIDMPISGPPRLAARGKAILARAISPGRPGSPPDPPG